MQDGHGAPAGGGSVHGAPGMAPCSGTGPAATLVPSAGRTTLWSLVGAQDLAWHQLPRPQLSQANMVGKGEGTGMTYYLPGT